MIEYASDKDYWHRYTDEYEVHCFSHLPNPQWILEWGVLHGESVKYLRGRFPSSHIVGVDKDIHPSLPQLSKVSYEECNQNDLYKVSKVFEKYPHFDLIIDDGSHRPEHQASCLMEGVQRMRSSGYYIIEDIHTNINVMGSPLHLILAIEHIKKINSDFSKLLRFPQNYFTFKQMGLLFSHVSDVHITCRGVLPKKCYMCKQSDFDYNNLRCSCGIPLYERDDSMSAILKIA